ncbi:polysaccharide deacetylase family protein [Halotia branconii]|uniref:Polysaccharide deacetylase family protein n=1 Tax=Halotia branconii CENA392 TaxID=1539056 RepID=A0AAJ6NXT8_9CYAN|nr:polysaccharide deacetylase family protein [Halotia branconii]WGV28627.1 polysaccharide deacetylase family protein [Halotia branconii CENA392]
MTDNNDDNVVSYQKNKNFPFSLALVSLIGFSLLNLEYTEPIVPVLGFHGVVNPKKSDSQLQLGVMHYPQKDLEKLLVNLINDNYWFLTSEDLYVFFLTKSQKIPNEHRNQKPIMISFDDGYRTVHTNLLPLLSKLENKYGKKIKVVLFINPGTLARKGNQDFTHLGCQELREGLKKGFYDIQSHGLNHQDLTTLNRRELINELVQSRTELRKCTQDLDPEQKVASHFAYPYGAYNKQVESYVSKYYLSSYLYNDEIVTYTCFKNYYEIPRLMVNRQKSAKQLLEIARGIFSKQHKEKNKQICQQ